MRGRAAALLGRAVFHPAALPDSAVLMLALVPVVGSGIAFFRLPAAEAAGIAVAIGVAAHAGARLARFPVPLTPVVPAVFAVALVGPGAGLHWAAAAAALAALLEVGRARFLPAARVSTGLVGYGLLLLAGRGALAAYLDPRTMRPFQEPIRLWLTFGGGRAAPLDPVRLYVGNVAGPEMATSLLAVAVSLAWLWYARRLSLWLLAGFAIGAAVLPITLGWNLLYHLESGPLWLVAGMGLAERRHQPATLLQPLAGVAAGLLAMVPRTRDFGIEPSILLMAAVQLLVAAVTAAEWAVRHRRRLAGALGRARAGASRSRGGQKPEGSTLTS